MGSDGRQSTGGMKLTGQDSLDAEVLEYISSYRDRDSAAESSSGSESQGSAIENEHKRDSGDQLGASVFSRHAHRTNRQFSSGSPGSLKDGRGSRTSTPRREPVIEGCLAIGPNARELYTTRTHIVKEGRRKRRVTEIIPKTPVPIDPDGTVAQSPSDAAALPTSSSEPPTGQRSNARTSATHSKICVIL